MIMIMPNKEVSQDVRALWVAWDSLVRSLSDQGGLDPTILVENLQDCEIWIKESEPNAWQQIEEVISNLNDFKQQRDHSNNKFDHHVLRCIDEINSDDNCFAQQDDLIEIYDDISHERIVSILSRLYKSGYITADIVPTAIEFKNIAIHPTVKKPIPEHFKPLPKSL
jgi:hypothetical protein